MFVNYLELQPGQKIVLKNQAVAQVVENIGHTFMRVVIYQDFIF